MFLEEGRYSEIETFKIPEQPKSVRLVKDDMASPELFLASSTNYEGNYRKILIHFRPVWSPRIILKDDLNSNFVFELTDFFVSWQDCTRCGFLNAHFFVFFAEIAIKSPKIARFDKS